MSKELYKNKEWLINKYKTVGTSTIAKECGVNDATINYYLRKFEVPIRTRGESLSITQNRRYTVNENYFEIIDNERKAYWLGFLMADAAMREYREGYFILSFELSAKDKVVIEEFIKDIDYSGKLTKSKRDENDRVRFFIANQFFCKHLLNHGIIPNKTGKESFPNIPKDYERDFIRGFFDGDGYISFKEKEGKRVRSKFHIVSCSYDILRDIKEKFENKGIVFSEKALSLKSGSDIIWELETSTFKNVNSIFKYMYYEDCICLGRKSNKFKLFNDYYINRSRNSTFKNFDKETERYSPNFTEM